MDPDQSSLRLSQGTFLVTSWVMWGAIPGTPTMVCLGIGAQKHSSFRSPFSHLSGNEEGNRTLPCRAQAVLRDSAGTYFALFKAKVIIVISRLCP